MTQIVLASNQLAEFVGMEKDTMLTTFKRQCFRNFKAEDVSDAQLASFVSVANTLKLNPLLPGMLYAYPEKNGGITPVIGPDGTFKKLAELGAHYECEVFPLDVTLPPTHAVAKIWLPDSEKERPHAYTAIFREWVIESNPNWVKRPRHMIRLRALKQCAREVIHGLPMDEDEFRETERVVSDAGNEPVNEVPNRRAAPARSDKGVATAIANAKPAEKASEPAKTETPPAPPVASTPPVTEAPPAEQKAPAASVEVMQEKSLVAGKVVTISAKISSFSVKVINQIPDSVKASFDGYKEVFIHKAGGPAWAKFDAGQRVTIKVDGRQTPNGVIGLIETIEAA